MPPDFPGDGVVLLMFTVVLLALAMDSYINRR